LHIYGLVNDDLDFIEGLTIEDLDHKYSISAQGMEDIVEE
jgi:hypothetical protein